MDIKMFIKEATLLLDMEASSIEEIVHDLLDAVFKESGDQTNHSSSTPTNIGAGMQRLFLTPNHSRRGSTWEISCSSCSLKHIQKRYLALARLAYPVNLGRSNEGTQIILLVISPQKEKKTKSDIELGRTFATILSDLEFRRQLIFAQNEEEVKALLCARAHELEEKQAQQRIDDIIDDCFESKKRCQFMSGLIADLKRRVPLYPSDFVDGIRGAHTIRKVTSSVFFLYFACLLPSIAFGVLNYNNTRGKIGVFRILLSQTIGGLFFGLTAGQPLTVLLTTAPLALYVKLTVIYDLEFYAFFGCVGLFNASFLFIYAAFDASRIISFSVNRIGNLRYRYNSINMYRPIIRDYNTVCKISASTFRPFLTETKRELIHDFALPSAVLVMSFVGSFLFKKVELDTDTFKWKIADFHKLNWTHILVAMGLSFPLSLLFFLEQNIASVIVNSPSNKLKKGTSYHWDLFVLGVINVLLSLFGLPWVHGALPQSPLHVRSLADMEERITVGNNVQQIVVRVRETRIATILAHIGIGLSLLMIPIPLTYIPRPVLAGLFVYMALASVSDNQLMERVKLIFIEQSAYPPSHYIRRVPQRRMHLFTCLQLIQLAVLCGCGFTNTPFVKMVFPILLFLQIHRLIPYVIERKYLEAMDRPM
ncbi:unnamed protein product [Hymenolepis diminuta]|uniref:Sodium bicarbonate transporter-like protein 11 n=2 Tax=Hymenolepis diminuta TaxID=6216 RepID=A0A158QEA8_HYMDI|nr:unnamed protein product [Hymenolepis diminuta]